MWRADRISFSHGICCSDALDSDFTASRNRISVTSAFFTMFDAEFVESHCEDHPCQTQCFYIIALCVCLMFLQYAHTVKSQGLSLAAPPLCGDV